MAGERHYLVSFEDVHATCGGVDISAITEIRLVAAANGVPQITLSVDGGHSDSASTMAAEGVSLDNARVIFATCRSLVKTDGGTLSLSLTCRIVGPDGEETQSLNLNGWMLIDAALSPVQRGGVCTASLTFAHPLYKAHLGGSMVGLLAAPPGLSTVTGSNPFEVFVNALSAYALAPRTDVPPLAIPGAASLTELQSALALQLTKAVGALTSAVSWTGGGLPAQNELAGWIEALWGGLASYGMPSAGNSVLQALLGGLVPECSLALGGDFTASTLDLGPFKPWASPSLTVSDSDIISLDFPQNDPTPISGVRFLVAMTSGGTVTSYHVMGAQGGDGAKPFEIFYVPRSELGAEYMYGPIHQFAEPGWLQHTAAYGVGLRAKDESDVVAANHGGFHTAVSIPRGGTAPVGGGVGKPPSLDYAKAALLCAKAYFETSYMKDWGFALTTRLMFSTSSGTVCPGRVVSVTTNSGEVVGGYITAVEHIISVASRSAITKIACSHPRFGSLPPAITSRENALYA